MERQRVLYPLNQFKTAYFAALSEIRALVAGTKSDEPALCGECGACQWFGHCEKALVAANDVTLLPDVGRSRKIALNGVGIKKIADIPKFDFSQVDIKGIGQKTIDYMKLAAVSVLSNKLQVLATPVLPDPPRKIYLDYEDDPSQDLIYLTGMWIDPAWEGLNYHGLLCTDEAGEARTWGEFQKICAAMAGEDYVVYHYSSYERIKLDSLQRKYGLEHRDAVGIFRGRMVDLFPIVKQSVVLPSRGYGLKKIAPHVGLKYSAENAGGAQSIVWFREYQKDQSKAHVLETLLKYNEEDCLVMKAVEGWLRRLECPPQP